MPSLADPLFLESYRKDIKDVAYVTNTLSNQMNSTLTAAYIEDVDTELQVADLAFKHENNISPQGISAASHYFDDSFEIDYNSNEGRSDLGPTDQLYTARGAQGMGLS